MVEDEASLLEAITFNLELEGYQVTGIPNGRDGLEAFQREYFDLVVLDVMLPDMDGFAVCQAIRDTDTHTPILFLTAKGTSSDRVQGLRLGADDYLTKPFDLEEFLLRVQNLVKRSVSSPEAEQNLNTFSFGGNEVNFLTFEVKTHSGAQKQLGKKEIRLLKLLVERKNQVVSRKEILDVVWGYDVYPSSRTIDNFILGFRKSFEVDSKSPQFFQSVRGVGYRFALTED